jgi:hypothetical protein
MTEHRIVTQEEWQTERDGLLAEEKELTRRSDELARKRRELPWVMRPMLHPRRAGRDRQLNGANDPLPQGAKRRMLPRGHGRLIPRSQRMA